MKHKLLFLLLILLSLSACVPLETILYTPAQTPEAWLQMQPFGELQFGSQALIIIQPSTSLIVYFLGILTIYIGTRFLQNRNHQKSGLWWGVALLFWGLGALLAGTSYEAFSYAIKCAGRDLCIWTSSWEIIYLIFSVWSIDAILAAVAYSSSIGKGRKLLLGYALVNAIVYTVIVLVGTFIPLKFLISFEFMLLLTAPSIFALFVINGKRYFKQKERLDLVLFYTWLGLGITIAAYFLYYLTGLTASLWEKGFWFSENDVLHIGLILWMLYIRFKLMPHIKDISQA